MNIITNHEVSKIRSKSIVIEDKKSGKQTEIETDLVVMAMGVEPSNPLEAKLIDHVRNLHVIGDAAGYSSLADATHQGFKNSLLPLNRLVTRELSNHTRNKIFRN